MKFAAAVLAAGSASRYGDDKVWLPLGGKPVWRWSVDFFLSHPTVEKVILVVHPSRKAEFEAMCPEGVVLVEGGATRQCSSRNAVVAAAESEYVLIHDAARPFLFRKVVDQLLAMVAEKGAVGAALRVTDTIKQVAEALIETTLDRSRLWAMQTPQIARRDWLVEAHDSVSEDTTDELALLEKAGFATHIVEGDPNTFKITTEPDYYRARAMAELSETRTGLGYDIHAFSEDASRTLMLGGISFPGERALDGHSDADVLLHAITDAILGAAALGDIGVHFPNTDPQWKGAPSLIFLEQAVRMVIEEGWNLLHIDATLIAEAPKVMKRALEIRESIRTVCSLTLDRVSIKATTNEKLGSLGRSEGIAAFAIATLRR